MLYKKHKRERIGDCRICSAKNVQLTWDHVPPKGAVELTEVEINTIASVMSSEVPQQRPEFSQNGLKFRTICKECNSNLLGGKYDQALVDFSLSVARVLKSRLYFPGVLHFRGQPNLIAKSVLGHLLAANLTGEVGNFESTVRPAVLNKDCQLPENIHIFYWLHPYDHQVALLNIVLSAIAFGLKSPALCSILKYFPIGFLVTSQPRYPGLEELTRWKKEEADVEQDLPIRFSGVSKTPFWPEGEGMVLFSNSSSNSVGAVPRGRRSGYG